MIELNFVVGGLYFCFFLIDFGEKNCCGWGIEYVIFGMKFVIDIVLILLCVDVLMNLVLGIYVSNVVLWIVSEVLVCVVMDLLGIELGEIFVEFRLVMLMDVSLVLCVEIFLYDIFFGGVGFFSVIFVKVEDLFKCV